MIRFPAFSTYMFYFSNKKDRELKSIEMLRRRHWSTSIMKEIDVMLLGVKTAYTYTVVTINNNMIISSCSLRKINH